MSEHRNKPEKLTLPESPKRNQEKKASHQPPFKIQLQKMSYDAKNQVFNRLCEARKNLIKQLEKIRTSKVIVFYSFDILKPNDFETIFDLVNATGEQNKLDLYLLSLGGFANPAYKIARLFQSYRKEKFSVLVPYYAKSAATILCLGADEIVMGLASELGPIDPQLMPLNNPPISALTLKEALDYITKAIKQDPKTAPLYAPLLDKINLMELGHFEREIESAKQYAEALLSSRKINPLDKKSAKTVANNFVQKYKTHGFVIDGKTASHLIGNTVTLLKPNDPVWKCMWQLHNIYDQYIKDKKIVKIIETINEAYEEGPIR